MSSALVDAAWHQFVLYTHDYESFCRERVGYFCHHVPTGSGNATDEPAMSRDEFVALYEAAFGGLPSVWDDSECQRPAMRLRRRRASDVFCVELEADRALLFRANAARELVCRVNLRARSALEFIATHPWFLIRELPGLKTSQERIELTRPLVRYGIVRIAV
jgi:hypothetical protein